MGYSKESERQNKALGDLLKGRTPEKRVMVGYEGKKQESGDKISKLSDVMKAARMPMFCSECDKVMKNTKLDGKMWRVYGHCFDCQIKFEHKLRLEGKYEEWEKDRIKRNQISMAKDAIEAIKEWRDVKAPEFYNNVGVNYPMLEKEKWDVDTENIKKMADEALDEYNKVLEQLENE